MSWRVEYLGLLIFSTLVDYTVGIKMGSCKSLFRRRNYLILSLSANIGLLFAFKYFNFLNDSLRELFNIYNVGYAVHSFDVLLPIGISFYTFQSLSYSLDVYYGKRSPEYNLIHFATYVSFFPQLVAGPIERSTSLLPQFKKINYFDYHRITAGMRLMVWGYFKKLVVADNAAVIVDRVYSNHFDYDGSILIFSTLLFAFQILADFSGYSDIAIGSAMILGFKLRRNFNRPYLATSISDFWHRWHISLSTWFRDYLYIPIGGKRVVRWRWYYNLLITFLLSGVWHGANWTFLCWGLLHGVFFIVSDLNKMIKTKLHSVISFDHFKNIMNNNFSLFLRKLISRCFVFSIVCCAWVLFRSDSLTTSWFILEKSFSSIFQLNLESFLSGLNQLCSDIGGGYSKREIVFLIVGILIMNAGDHFTQSGMKIMSSYPTFLRSLVYSLLLMIILIFGMFKTQSAFIYFQF